MDSVYSARIRAGKRRTYFFDVRATRGNDYYLTITESRKRFNDDGYDRHKIFLYKEDFNKFIKGLTEAVEYVKTDLMPDFDFDAFNHDALSDGEAGEHQGMDHTNDRVKDYSVHNASSEATTDEPSEPKTNEPSEPETHNDITPAPTSTSMPNHKDEEVDKW